MEEKGRSKHVFPTKKKKVDFVRDALALCMFYGILGLIQCKMRAVIKGQKLFMCYWLGKRGFCFESELVFGLKIVLKGTISQWTCGLLLRNYGMIFFVKSKFCSFTIPHQGFLHPDNLW